MMIDDAVWNSHSLSQCRSHASSEKNKNPTARALIRRVLREKIKFYLEKVNDASILRFGKRGHARKQALVSSDFSIDFLNGIHEEFIDAIPPVILNELVHDNDLAQLGDSLVNFLFSVALTVIMEQGMGVKISDSVLAESLRKSSWWKDNILILKGKKGTLGNYVEALVLIAWVEGWMTLDEFVACFIKFPPSPEKLRYHRSRKEALVPPITRILDELYQRYVDSLRRAEGEK